MTKWVDAYIERLAQNPVIDQDKLLTPLYTKTPFHGVSTNAFLLFQYHENGTYRRTV